LQEIIVFSSRYISTPQMALDMMLKSTKVEIELLTDVDQILFVEQNIRGGMSYINQRYCRGGPDTYADTGETFHAELTYYDGEPDKIFF
jgi:hypothetical protein